MTTAKRRSGWLASGMVVVLAVVAVGQEYEISRSTIDGGGVMRSPGGDLELSGTIGQPDVGVMAGGAMTLTGGFWFGEPPNDCNSDGGVNLIDYGDLDACASGPNGGLLPSSCACFDQDADDDVDLKDMGAFQRLFGAP